jgi:hypothetical protein
MMSRHIAVAPIECSWYRRGYGGVVYADKGRFPSTQTLKALGSNNRSDMPFGPERDSGVLAVTTDDEESSDVTHALLQFLQLLLKI